MSISLEEAIRISFANKPVPEEEIIGLSEAEGRILAKDIEAAFPQPPFRRSCMDGYALRSADYTPNAKMKVTTEVDAGDTRILTLGENEVIRIMTGGSVPEGADVVVPQEMTDYGEDEVMIYALPSRDNISPIGEDFPKGAVVAKGGQAVNAQIISCLAAAGVAKVPVLKKLRVTIIGTGDEVQEVGTELLPGHIYDSNAAYIEARVKELGCEVVRLIREKDDLDLIATDIDRGVAESDYVITLGGVSVGKKDHLEPAMKRIGATILFHGVAVKPGMPTMLSVKNGVPILALSGNPYSAAALFEVLFPYNRYITVQAKLHDGFENKHGVPRLVRGYYDGCDVALALGQKNGSTYSNIATNCIAEIPGCNDKQSETVKTRLLTI